ncbi:MAG: hypothetical protein ACYTGL_13390 [Planctomycetota bacterium]|jgi:hypothetical protein
MNRIVLVREEAALIPAVERVVGDWCRVDVEETPRQTSKIHLQLGRFSPIF